MVDAVDCRDGLASPSATFILERVVRGHQFTSGKETPDIEETKSKDDLLCIVPLVLVEFGMFVDGRKYRRRLMVDLSTINNIMSSMNARKRGPVDNALDACYQRGVVM